MLLEKSLAVNSHFQLQFEKKQNCYVLLYPEGMVQLNFTAGEIMNLCDGENNYKQIVKILSIKFKSETIQEDVLAFLEEAMKRKWVVYHE